LGVDIRLNAYAEAGDVLAENPDVVIVATGGLPDIEWLEGAEYCTSVWDVLTDSGRVRNDVIVYDGSGRHQAVSCALHLAEGGSSVQFVTIDDNIGMEMEYNARVVYRKRFAQNGVKSLIDHQLVSVRQQGNQLLARFRHELTGTTIELAAAQVVIEHGTVPVDEVFTALRARSNNDGITDIDTLLARQSQPVAPGKFALHRIGDAVSSRNVHAAIYDALRLCSAL
jgi:pyruvate/2-oxoglutarate dehydrogenase complex dihydrolipoamide dehydrogenase (E3) component